MRTVALARRYRICDTAMEGRARMRTQTKMRPVGRRPRTPLVSLEKAARANYLRSFVAATEGVDWSTCEPKDFILAVGLALSLGAFALARDLAENG
jgi:hypothetical protein